MMIARLRALTQHSCYIYIAINGAVVEMMMARLRALTHLMGEKKQDFVVCRNGAGPIKGIDTPYWLKN